VAHGVTCVQAISVRRAGSNQAWRFCQQCGKLELLSAFDSNKRSCRRQLARRREAFARQANGTARTKVPSWSMSVPLAVLDPPAGAAPPAANMLAHAAPALTTPMQAALGAGGPVGCASSNPMLEQQLQFFQNKCTLLRMQIQMLEQQQGCAGTPEQEQQWGTAASECMLSCAGNAVCSPDPAQCTQPGISYTPFFRTSIDAGQWNYGLGPAAGAAGLAACTSTAPSYCGTGNPMPLPAGTTSGCSSMADISLLPPGSHSTLGTAAGTRLEFLSTQEACLAGAAASEQLLHATSLVPQHGVQSGHVNTFEFSVIGSRDAPVCLSRSWSCAQQQQILQPPMHVAQMLGGMSAPLPHWGTSISLPAATCGTKSGSLLPMCARGAAAEHLMVLKDDEDAEFGVNSNEFDSPEEMAGGVCFLGRKPLGSPIKHMQVVNLMALQAGGQPPKQLRGCPAYAPCKGSWAILFGAFCRVTVCHHASLFSVRPRACPC
jgi:hypothetical protein